MGEQELDLEDVKKLLEREKERVRALESSIQNQVGELYEAKVKAEEQQSFLQSIMFAMPDGLVLIDEENVIYEVNDAFAGLLGKKREDILNKKISNWISKEGVEVFHEVQEGAKKEIKAFHEDFLLLCEEGDSIPVSVSVAQLTSVSPQVKKSSFVCVFHDARGRKALEEQLVTSKKLESVGTLASGIAHEINTPAQYIIDNAEYLQESFPDLLPILNKYLEEEKGSSDAKKISVLLEEFPGAIEDVLNGGERIAKLVQTMKAFSHPGSKEKETCDINKCLELAISMSNSAWKYVATIERDEEENLPEISALPHELNQAFLNIIVNAAHALEETREQRGEELGTITVSTKDVGRDIEISIMDNGPGIPKEIQSRVFDPFFTTKEVGKGTGQGLSYVYSMITEHHGGKIKLESKPGKTCFTISLPKGV